MRDVSPRLPGCNYSQPPGPSSLPHRTLGRHQAYKAPKQARRAPARSPPARWAARSPPRTSPKNSIQFNFVTRVPPPRRWTWEIGRLRDVSPRLPGCNYSQPPGPSSLPHRTLGRHQAYKAPKQARRAPARSPPARWAARSPPRTSKTNQLPRTPTITQSGCSSPPCKRLDDAQRKPNPPTQPTRGSNTSVNIVSTHTHTNNHTHRG